VLRRLRAVLPKDPAALGLAVEMVVAWRKRGEELSAAAMAAANLESKLISQGLEPYGGYVSGGSGSSSEDDGDLGTDRDAIKRRALAATRKK